MRRSRDGGGQQSGQDQEAAGGRGDSPASQAGGLGHGPPRAPLGPALRPKVLCHALSCGFGSLIPKFWEAWAEFPEGVSQFSKQIGWLVVTAEPGQLAARETGGGNWWPRGTQELPHPCEGLVPPRAARPRLCRQRGKLRHRKDKALVRSPTMGQGSNPEFWAHHQCSQHL